ncbi:MAG TPA: TlpA disulfide reductase family protein [Gemmatimonadaceae bacterium]|nr:TlpA disulfide reductase family protein [Gemmatimonadaceae bacterium]HSC32788.1 TlpA disulfide reductase family protein [Gemmatimonadaceae bacterium]
MMWTRVAMLVACVAMAAAPALAAQDEIGVPVGAAAPGAVVHTLDGKSVNLDQYIGKSPVVLEFWATWCSNCKELEPKFLDMVKKYSPKVTFVDVAVSVNQSPERVKLYAQKYHYTQAMVYDTDGNAVSAYNVPATSYVVVINKAGKVVYTGLGGDQDLEGAIKRAL